MQHVFPALQSLVVILQYRRLILSNLCVPRGSWVRSTRAFTPPFRGNDRGQGRVFVRSNSIAVEKSEIKPVEARTGSISPVVVGFRVHDRRVDSPFQLTVTAICGTAGVQGCQASVIVTSNHIVGS